MVNNGQEEREYSIFEKPKKSDIDYYPFCDEFVRAIFSGFWTADEFTFSSDVHDFKTILNKEEKEIILKTLSAISQIECRVKERWATIGSALPHDSIKSMGMVMGANEVIHQMAYLKLLKVLDMRKVSDEHMKLPVLKNRAQYLEKHTHKNYSGKEKQFVYSLILFTLFIENVSLFSQFYIGLWLGRFKNVLKDTCNQLHYTTKEEGLHSDIGIKLIQTIKKEHPELFDEEMEKKVLQETEEAFKAESNLIDWILGDYEGPRISARILKEFIKRRFNESLTRIGYKAIYQVDAGAERDFEWFYEEVLGNSQMDFFYGRPTEYSKKNKSFSEDELF